MGGGTHVEVDALRLIHRISTQKRELLTHGEYNVLMSFVSQMSTVHPWFQGLNEISYPFACKKL